LSGYKIFLQ